MKIQKGCEAELNISGLLKIGYLKWNELNLWVFKNSDSIMLEIQIWSKFLKCFKKWESRQIFVIKF